MSLRMIALALTGAALSACGSGDRSEQAAAPGAANGTTAANNAGEAVAALGLTERQLRDAELVDATGNDIGDVEGVVRDASGAVTHLLVEVEDTSPDRHVQVPLTGLQPVPDGDDHDIRGSLTRDQLMALPEVQR